LTKQASHNIGQGFFNKVHIQFFQLLALVPAEIHPRFKESADLLPLPPPPPRQFESKIELNENPPKLIR